MAAYAFDEGSGTTVADASGNGNTGTSRNATWTTAGKFGGALSFNGTTARVNIPNSASLQLTIGDDARGVGEPGDRHGAWRDVIYKGNDNYYLDGHLDQRRLCRRVAGTFGGCATRSVRYAVAADEHLVVIWR